MGRALIGVSLGALVFAVHRAGGFRGADFAALDYAGALAPSPAPEQSIVLVVAPTSYRGGEEASVATRRAALRNALAAGAVAVGIEEWFLVDDNSDEPLWRDAADPRCAVACSGGSHVAGPRVATRWPGVGVFSMERISCEGGIGRRVAAAAPPGRGQQPRGFIAETVTRAAQRQRQGAGRSRDIETNLRRLASASGLVIDYSLPDSAVNEVRLAALAEGPVAALRPLVAGRVVVFTGIPHSHRVAQWQAALAGELPARRAGPAPTVAWAIATALVGPSIREAPPEVYGSGLVLLSVLLMLGLSDRGLRGKATASLVALSAVLAVFLAARIGWRLFVPPWPAAGTVLLAFVVTVCLELSEAGQMIDRELRARLGLEPTTGEMEEASPRAQVERALQSIVRWHELPAAALVFGGGGRLRRVAMVLGEGPAKWPRAPSLYALGSEAMNTKAPILGTWPSAAARGGEWHVLAIPVVGWGGQAVSLMLASRDLPLPAEAVEFGVRAARQLLTGRHPGADVSFASGPMREKPSALPLPARVAWLRSARMGRQRQTALAAAWRSSVHEAVILFDMAGKPVLWNRRAEALFGTGESDLARTHFVPLLVEATGLSPDEARQAATDVLVHGTPFICDIEDPTGKYNYVATLTQVAIEGDAPGGLAIRCIDVTGICRPARVEARLMSVAAHEMRTPLTSIIGYSDLLLGKVGKGSVARRYAAAIHRQAGRVESIVRELLAVTRLEAGREELVIETVDVMMVAQSIVAALEPVAKDHGVSLSAEGETAHTEVRGDVRKLERVVENLVTNAIKYSPPGASVAVNVRRTGDRVVLSATDSGHGIPAKDVPHVFEKFYRARNRHTQAVAGTGLGLAIVKLIVEAHGGEVTLRSAVGAGSTFAVRLPVAGPRSAQASSSVA